MHGRAVVIPPVSPPGIKTRLCDLTSHLNLLNHFPRLINITEPRFRGKHIHSLSHASQLTVKARNDMREQIPVFSQGSQSWVDESDGQSPFGKGPRRQTAYLRMRYSAA
jgi:hypothetical protein